MTKRFSAKTPKKSKVFAEMGKNLTLTFSFAKLMVKGIDGKTPH
jgi:hypothetical protein